MINIASVLNMSNVKKKSIFFKAKNHIFVTTIVPATVKN
jgi:hypothetical protein